jgi:hypothetical protein
MIYFYPLPTLLKSVRGSRSQTTIKKNRFLPAENNGKIYGFITFDFAWLQEGTFK